MVGSTALKSTDPEALRALAERFERMKGVVEEHGGSVEKFIGDAVMAVFGVPVVPRGRRATGLPGGSGDPGGVPGLGIEGGSA